MGASGSSEAQPDLHLHLPLSRTSRRGSRGNGGQSHTIKTFARFRGGLSAQHAATSVFELHTNEPKVEVDMRELGDDEIASNKRQHWLFSFDGLLGEHATQQQTFDLVAKPVVDSVLHGFNGTIFAYGQTGSGKTHTLTGNLGARTGTYRGADAGMVPRALQGIFAHVARDRDARYEVRVSYLELYNETGFDLLESCAAAVAAAGGGDTYRCGTHRGALSTHRSLASHRSLHGGGGGGGSGGTPYSSGGSSGAELPRTLLVVEQPDGSVSLNGLSSLLVESEEAAMELLCRGDAVRAARVCRRVALNARRRRRRPPPYPTSHSWPVRAVSELLSWSLRPHPSTPP